MASVIVLCALACASGCSREADPPSGPAVRAGYNLDNSPAWSWDDQWIAFHRRLPSNYGPAGAYVISRRGGTPRFITPGSVLYPNDLRFSPDGKTLVAQDRGTVVLIDVDSGAKRYPVQASNGGLEPDWSPDGLRLVYLRGGVAGYPQVDPESTGLHIIELSPGLDRALRSDGEVLYGQTPRWSPDGERIVYSGFGPGGTENQIVSVRPDGSDPRVLVRSSDSEMGRLQWLHSRIFGSTGVLFNLIGNPPATRFVREDGSAVTDWPRTLLRWDAVSHEGRDLVFLRVDPDTRATVLSIVPVRAPTEVGSFQLTTYIPLE